ncbi:MAG: OB-fold nucleic acid binding domain-containing protein [Candidatus Nanoarchaeia archaeon]
MINIPYQEIVKRIKEKAGISEEEIEAKVKEKTDQLSGLISKEGAAHIVANDLGVQILQSEGPKKIKDIFPGLRGVEVVGKVMRIFPVNEFERNGQKGKVGSFIIADETGQLRITAWHDMTSVLSDINQGDVAKITNGFVKDNQGRTEVHLNKDSKVEANPEGISVDVDVGEQPSAEAKRKSISEISENDGNVEVLATIVQVFDPKFFPVCPSCGKKLVQSAESMSCPEHGNVEPKYGQVLNLVLDDGTDNIRAVFFRDVVLKVTKKTQEQMENIRQNPDQFEPVKTELLGETVKVIGRVTRNQMFDRLELLGNDVMEADPQEEIKKIKESGEEEKIPSLDEL